MGRVGSQLTTDNDKKLQHQSSVLPIHELGRISIWKTSFAFGTQCKLLLDSKPTYYFLLSTIAWSLDLIWFFRGLKTSHRGAEGHSVDPCVPIDHFPIQTELAGRQTERSHQLSNSRSIRGFTFLSGKERCSWVNMY